MTRQKALVTGGTRGIGKAMATKLVASDYEVWITGTSPHENSLPNCQYLACDFLNQDAVNQLCTQISKIDFSVLINNAGINKVGPLIDYDTNDFLKIQQINVTAPFSLCKALVPRMKERRFGRILNITSIFGVVSHVGRAAYSTSKFGLFGMSRALALEVAKDNILVNCLAPGFIDTDLTRHILGEKGIAEILHRIPMGRLAQAEEIAKVAHFLVSRENTYLTGQNIICDGGFTSE